MCSTTGEATDGVASEFFRDVSKGLDIQVPFNYFPNNDPEKTPVFKWCCAANLMFCEDAARRVQATLANDNHFEDFWVRVNHLESLHPHDAVAIVTKGIEGGYRDDPLEFPH